MSDAISEAIREATPELVALRREFHARPELGFQETETAALIAQHLADAGLNVRAEVGGTGIVGVLEGSAPGPTLMIRADIDGLPIKELTGLPFASKNGRMHACGHDGHISMALVAAELLAARREDLAGRVVFVFQPAEEITQGALAMIADEVMTDHAPDRVIGLHLWNPLPMGRVGVNSSTVFASADAIRVTVRGRGGHGALPHLAVDPVVAAAHIVAAAQTVISREKPPNEMGVLTFGQVHGGVAPNVIPDEVSIEGTVRGYTPEIRTQILAAAERVAKQTGEALRTNVTFEHLYGAPPVVNDAGVASFVAEQAAEVVGPDRVGEEEPVSVGDDMAEFLNRAPGCYFLLGAATEGADPHHSARFDFDEECLPIGVEIFVRSALAYLRASE